MQEPQRETKHTARSRATRKKLVAAARALFAERGYAAVGTEEVVRAAGVTRGALYHQFGDKADLFEAVVEEVEAETTQRIAQGALAAASDPVEALRAGAREFLEVCAEPAVERLLLLDAPSVLGWDRWREIGMRHGLGVVTGVLQAGIDAGALAPAPVVPLAHVIIGALDEGAMYVARAEDRDVAREEVLGVLDRLLDGLAARP